MDDTTVTLVPHTHWDREWYEPFSVFSDRLVAMMDTLIELADRGFPHFHLDGQTAMIDDYLAVRPERAADIERLIREGRLSAGPWFTQMDEFLTSGESHIRNLEKGLARARELGRALEVGYMPDQFGHIGQMPQILRQGGVDRAVVWRGVPAVVDRDAFVWESPDGSAVLTEYLAFGYFNGAAFDKAADPADLADAVLRSVERQRSFMASDRILVMVGYDHAGPDATLPERLAAARPTLGGVSAAIGGLADHLDGERLAGYPPVWRGELRSSARAHLLPNVISGRVHQKRERGRVEALIERYAEPLAALVPGFAWPADELDRAWTLLLWNGAHDSACGCSHDQVAADVDARFAEARAIGEDIVARALTSLGERVAGAGVIRFNPSAFERDGVPGLGWMVAAHGDEDPPEVPVDVREGDDGAIVADDVELVLLDEPDVGDLYNFCFAEPEQVPRGPAEIHIEGHTVRAWFDEALEVRMRITRREGEPFLRLEGVIENQRPDHRLRLHVTLPRSTMSALAGAPFELVERPLASEGGELETPSATWPARGMVLAADTALFHEGVFEYEVAGGRALAVTLLRCVGTISRERLATRPFEAGPNVPTPLAQMQGETAFSVGVWPGATFGGLLANHERFALPIVSAIAEATATVGTAMPAAGHLLELTGDAALSNVRRRDGRVEVRLWNQSVDAPARASVAGSDVELGPARIETVGLDR
ncbi:MAG: glycoside hydrolase family 38 N-terminal domain-containing protein [Actinomycetota bacterium]